MAEPAPQSYATHRKFVPLFHVVTFGILALNFLYRLYIVVRYFSVGAVMTLLVSAALILLAFFARTFALTNQDRIIRLEERLRLERLLPAELKPRIGELSPGQLVALRFAGDEELPALVRQVLDERIADRDEIKKRIKSWRADHLRV